MRQPMKIILNNYETNVEISQRIVIEDMINFRRHYLGKHSMGRPQLLPGHLSWTHQVNSKQGSQIQRVHLVTVSAECY